MKKETTKMERNTHDTMPASATEDLSESTRGQKGPHPVGGTPELHVAVFGELGAGKTVLLSAFFHAQTQPEFEKTARYKIQAVDKAQGSELLGRFMKLAKGVFPHGSTKFDDYAFDFFPEGLTESGLRIHWYDYPGRWWQETPDDLEEREKMKHGLLKLASSQVGILVLDGEKYRNEGMKHVNYVFGHFANEFDRLRRDATTTNHTDFEASLPRDWIIALSKADLLPSTLRAEEFQRAVCEEASGQLRKLSVALGAAARVGDRFLVFSSARVEGLAIDPNTTLGVTMLAPALLLTTIETAAREAQARGSKKEFGESLLEGVRGLFKEVDKLLILLPKKLQVIGAILKALPFEDLLNDRIDKVRAARDKALKKGHAMAAVVNSMMFALQDDKSRAFYRNQ